MPSLKSIYGPITRTNIFGLARWLSFINNIVCLCVLYTSTFAVYSFSVLDFITISWQYLQNETSRLFDKRILHNTLLVLILVQSSKHLEVVVVFKNQKFVRFTSHATFLRFNFCYISFRIHVFSPSKLVILFSSRFKDIHVDEYIVVVCVGDRFSRRHVQRPLNKNKSMEKKGFSTLVVSPPHGTGSRRARARRWRRPIFIGFTFTVYKSSIYYILSRTPSLYPLFPPYRVRCRPVPRLLGTWKIPQ